MDNLQKFISQVRGRLVVILLVNNVLIFAGWWAMSSLTDYDNTQIIFTLAAVALISTVLLPLLSAKSITEPTRKIWQAILHIAPDAGIMPAPDLTKYSIGQDLVVNLVNHVYQLASVVETVEKTAAHRPTDLRTDFIANSLPLPLIVLDKKGTVLFANKLMLDYIKRSRGETIGQNFYSILDLSFGSSETLDKWLDNAKANQAVATNTWERVKLNLPDESNPRSPLFDLAAYYNRSNPEGFETMLVFFDHTAAYSQDDQALSFVALAVHELRAPVTLLRGYIEALEEDLEGKLDPEMADFMHKMKAAAQRLTVFINNMSNVARIEGDQLVLKLHEDSWDGIVKSAVEDESLRAKVQGVTITTEVEPNLPSVGVDRVSIYEVISNLLDNAVKYSKKGQKVILKSYLNKDGEIETTIQDMGVGIPESVLPNLFEKFYRSHRSRTQVGGTGLGLYLSKTIVDAHGGHIWVRSKEGQGSTFGFTVLPYTKLAEEKKTGDNNDITRGAHGWIKNHSLYSR
ncbi:MAG TPA: ATP-binding protein [Patescibacteria group bacterium]|nr:ATP-binding protein [Patescibacteria group bacterium]